MGVDDNVVSLAEHRRKKIAKSNADIIAILEQLAQINMIMDITLMEEREREKDKE